MPIGLVTAADIYRVLLQQIYWEDDATSGQKGVAFATGVSREI